MYLSSQVLEASPLKHVGVGVTLGVKFVVLQYFLVKDFLKLLYSTILYYYTSTIQCLRGGTDDKSLCNCHMLASQMPPGPNTGRSIYLVVCKQERWKPCDDGAKM